MRAARPHEYTDEMSEALEIDDVPRPGTTAADIVALVEGGPTSSYGPVATTSTR